jgi:hypothetical protein
MKEGVNMFFFNILKNVVVCAAIMALTLFSIQSYASQAEGLIEEIRVCGTGKTSGPRWRSTLQFKVAGKWFGTYADYYDTASGADRDNSLITSIVMLAYSQMKPVHVVATDSWSSTFSQCGNSTGHVLHDHGGDYISIK